MNVIGLMGESGSGKDAVAGWFQRKGWIRVALADPLKRFVHAALGHDAVTLWGPASLRANAVDFRRGVRRIEGAIMDFSLDVPIAEERRSRFRFALDAWFNDLRARREMVTAREALQTLGTECGRAFEPDIWVRYLFERIVPHLEDFEYNALLGLLPRATRPPTFIPREFGVDLTADITGVVVSDVRFKNEVEGILARGGRVYRLNRPGKPVGDGPAGGVAGHVSETEQRGIPDEILTGILNLPEGLTNLEAYLNQLSLNGYFVR